MGTMKKMAAAIRFLCLCLILLISLAFGSDFMSIDGRLFIPDGTSAANLKVSLNGYEYVTMAKHDGSFTFHSVPSGVYLVDVLSIKQTFPQLKIKVSTNDNSVNVVEYKHPGAKRTPASYPLQLTALVPTNYFQQHPPFSLTGMLFGNPMMLMMVVMGGLMIFFPNLLKGMELDEEKMKELGMEPEEMDGGDPMKKLQKLMGMEEKKDEDE